MSARKHNIWSKNMSTKLLLLSLLAVSVVFSYPAQASVADITASPQTQSCFLLWELGVGQVRKHPDEACQTKLSPASTFKIPHALAALDAEVVTDITALQPYGGRQLSLPAWRRDHSLQSA
jgi:beta-lactamase class D